MYYVISFFIDYIATSFRCVAPDIQRDFNIRFAIQPKWW